MSDYEPPTTGSVIPFSVNWQPRVTPDPATNGAHPEPDRPRPWRPIDLTDVLNGDWEPPKPTVGARDDGVGLFYPGRVHTVASEPEGGKTWFALAAAAHEISRDNNVVYLDFEDDEMGVTSRLRALGISAPDILARFHYINPDQSITLYTNADDLEEVIGDTKPTLAIIDGVTEAMALHGLELKDNTDIAKFGVMIPRKIADAGPAVTMLDHVTKDPETRGRWALGGQHKLAGLNGAAYILENRHPFGIGITGTSSVKIAKDRPGQLRRHAHPSGPGLYWFADLVLESTSDTVAYTHLHPAKPRDTGAVFRPTKLMAKVSAALAVAQGPLSANALLEQAGGKRSTALLALELLVTEGYAEVKKDGQSKLHSFVRAYEGDDREDPDSE